MSSYSLSAPLVVLVLVLALALAPASGAKQTSLRSLLNEGQPNNEVPAVLSYADCLALGIDDTNGATGANGCGNFFWFPGWAYGDNGHCVLAGAFHTTSAGADGECNANGAGSSLVRMCSNAERCLITYWVGKYNTNSIWYWSGVNDIDNEGVYIDGDSNPVPAAYLNWAPGEPTGAAEDCVMFMNNMAYDVSCINAPSGHSVCTKDAVPTVA